MAAATIRSAEQKYHQPVQIQTCRRVSGIVQSVHMEKELLNKELAKCSSDHKETSQSRVTEIARLTDILENQPLQFNDELVRQMLQCIVVENKEQIKVIFNDGTEIDQPIQ